MKIVIYSYNEFSMYWQSQIQLKNTCAEKLGTEEETVGVQSDCEVYDTGPKTSNTIEVCNFLISCDVCTIVFGIVLSPPHQEVVQSGTTPLLAAEENKDTISVEKEHPNAEVVSVPSTETDVAVTFSNDIPPARSVRPPPL